MFEIYKIIGVLISLILVVIQALIVHYLMRLEKIGCECAMDWRRNYIMFFFVITILYVASAFFISRETLPILQVIITVFGLLNVVFTLQYVHKLKKEKCECSVSIYREVMMVVAIFNAVMYSLLLTLIIFFLFTMISYAKAASNGVASGKKAMSVKPLKPFRRK